MPTLPNLGLVQAYVSSSSSYNYAPLGLGLRASGHGAGTCILAFPGGEPPGPLRDAAALLAPHLRLEFLDKKDMATCLSSPDFLGKRCLQGDPDILVLDGVLRCVTEGSLPEKALLDIVSARPKGAELLLSGQGRPEWLLPHVDLLTEMCVHKGSPSGESGTVEVVTGNGKGKSTYCFGRALVASGRNVPCLIVQFIKSPLLYGEVKAMEGVPLLQIRSMGEGFIRPRGGEIAPKHHEAACRAWSMASREILSGEFGLVVLDEVNIATHLGLLDPQSLLALFAEKPSRVTLLLSGRNAHPAIVETAASVIEMVERKHPYERGVQARKGIEF